MYVEGVLTPASGSMTNDDIAAQAGILHTKMYHRVSLDYSQATGSAVATETRIIHIPYTAFVALAAKASVDVAAIGDSTVVIDIKTASSGGAFSTILSSTLTIDSSTAADTPTSLAFAASPNCAAGGMVQIIVTSTAGTGTLPQGLCLTLTGYEAPS
jgi:hypothetical protein